MGQNASSGHRCQRGRSFDHSANVDLKQCPRSEEMQRKRISRPVVRHASTIDVPSSPVPLNKVKQKKNQDCIAEAAPGDEKSNLPPANSVEQLVPAVLSNLSLVDEGEADDETAERLLSDEDATVLLQTFESCKYGREYLGWKGMLGIYETLPEAVQSFRRSPNMPIRKGDNWEIMGQGIVFLSGIERFLLRVDNSKKFHGYAKSLVRSHRGYAVSLQNMLTAMDIFQNVIVTYLTAREAPETNGKITRAWSNFFDVLRKHLTIASTTSVSVSVENN